MEDLKKRVNDFNSLRLPGQPFWMHMGTIYLVNDLWEEIQKRDNELRKLVEDLKDTPQEGDFKEYALYRLKKLLDGGE